MSLKTSWYLPKELSANYINGYKNNKIKIDEKEVRIGIDEHSA